jgi:hypothetical protein
MLRVSVSSFWLHPADRFRPHFRVYHRRGMLLAALCRSHAQPFAAAVVPLGESTGGRALRPGDAPRPGLPGSDRPGM